MLKRDIVVIGGSAGSLRPLQTLVGLLPGKLGAAVFVVQHGSSNSWVPSQLTDILASANTAPVELASERPVEMGKIYVCPRNHHLSIENDRMRLDMGPKEHFTRPAIDVLFRSAAQSYGRRAVGVLLSGSLGDGTAGLWQIKSRGGLTLVQDPSEAEYPQMPASAIAGVEVDFVLPADLLGAKLRDSIAGASSNANGREGLATVLIVEDDLLVAHSLRARIKQIGYTVSGCVTSGEAAVLHAFQNNPDLILMDIRLQGPMNGVDAARRIWERQQIPSIFVTANADAATLNEVKTVNNYGFIVKPFHSVNLQAVMELALDRREKELR
jgi:chemotaxis response regulator CheB